MPATAGRVKMPHNNRVSSSSALRVTGIWKSMGHDPYAPEQDKESSAVAAAEEELANEQAQGLLALAILSNKGVSDSRGACKKCGMVGHLAFQCRNQVMKNAQAAAESALEDYSSSNDDDISVSDVSSSDSEHDLELRPATERWDGKRRRDNGNGEDDGERRNRENKESRKQKRKHHKDKKERKRERKKGRKHENKKVKKHRKR